MTDTRQLIDTYFELSTSPDREAYFALFADDVVVEDEGRERHGIDAVRAWRTEIPPVTYAVRAVTDTETGQEAVAEIAGDFPGSPVDLAFTFRFDEQDRIAALTIRP